MARVIAIGVGSDPNSHRNLEYGVETGTWGFPRLRPWYDRVIPGCFVLLGTDYSHPTENKSPRKQLHVYAQGVLGKVVVAQVTGSMRSATAPHWPDEVAERRVKYRERFPLSPLFLVDDVTLSGVPRDLADAFRMSAINQGEGRIVDVSDGTLRAFGAMSGLALSDLESLFSDTPGVDHRDIVPQRRNRRGAGRTNDPAANAAVERWAVDRARELYEAEGWTVEELGKPYDLHCTRGSEERHVEVKGTTGEGAKVILTPNEVIHASLHTTDLVVVTEIALDRASSPIACSGGRRQRFTDWVPSSEHLRASQYEYQVPWAN